MTEINERLVKTIIPHIEKMIKEHEKKVGIMYVEIRRDESYSNDDDNYDDRYYGELKVFKKPLIIGKTKIYGYDTDGVNYYWTDTEPTNSKVYSKMLNGKTDVVYESDVWWETIFSLAKYLLRRGFSLNVRI